MATNKTQINARVKYDADLSGPEDGPTGVTIRRDVVHRVIDGAGRRQWSKESKLNVRQAREVVAELTMAQAVELMASLAEAIGFMAVSHPECKVGEDNEEDDDEKA